MKARARGFTLIELLVVMVIIIALIAIFVPQVPAIMNWYRVHLSDVYMQQLTFGVDMYRKTYGEYPHDTIWWANGRLNWGTHDVEYLSSQGCYSLYLALQGPDGAGWGPSEKSPDVTEFGPIPESPGFVGKNISNGRTWFEDPFGRPILYYKARVDSKYSYLSTNYDDRQYRYVQLTNRDAWKQRGADDLPYGSVGVMINDTSGGPTRTHWVKRLTASKVDATCYPYNGKTYLIWMAGADARFGYWSWSEEVNGYVADPDPYGVADGNIGRCDDRTNFGK